MFEKNILKELGIIAGKDTKVGDIFQQVIPDFTQINYRYPSEYVKFCWERYNKYMSSSQSYGNSNNTNGKFFEYVLATLCVRENILPLFLSAKVAFVPNVIYDFIFYTSERGPICWSLKTSLRERYKQADLEAIALKYVHRKSLCYLITLSEEAQNVKQKIKEGEVIGLDDVVIATEPEFDTLIEALKEYELISPSTIEIITSNQVVTHEKVKAVFNRQ